MRVIVTGGAAGIGLCTARHLADRGAVVRIIDLRVDTVPATLEGFEADVRDEEAVLSAVDAAVHSMSGLDALVNNAGIGAQGTVLDNDFATWHRVLDVNLMGAVRVIRAALPELRKSSRACIVNMASIAATAGLPDRALYSASKGAILALTRAMAADHVREGIRVNAVSPGTVSTEWVDRLLAQAKDGAAELRALESRQPHGRLVAPEEVAAAVGYLLSPLAGSTTGANLEVDGGMAGLRMRAT
ncbi:MULTISPECIES: SDR family oxidoreductase [Microbacterium]|uniref:SDR family NAD(P)-dependent oxidoreductase n=1 Tax=Microbacterium TaxID=33882 RepID=UPI00146CB6D5|nr:MULTISPECIES: SDR family oxidoreductase [Microbacterium]